MNKKRIKAVLAKSKKLRVDLVDIWATAPLPHIKLLLRVSFKTIGFPGHKYPLIKVTTDMINSGDWLISSCHSLIHCVFFKH